MGVSKRKRTRVKVKQKAPKTHHRVVGTHTLLRQVEIWLTGSGAVLDERIRKRWDQKASVKQNYKALGLNIGGFKVNTTEGMGVDKVEDGACTPVCAVSPF